jgi:GTP cyclohydrolase I
MTMIDRRRAEVAVADLLGALGYDVASDALAATPARVARAWEEQLGGRSLVAEEILSHDFDAEGYDEMVLLRAIPFYSTCEHHLLPFHGSADVAYVPSKGRVVGLSKLARLVDMHARRLQLQERLTAEVAADLTRVLAPVGVAVVVRAQHLCVCSRGVQKPGAEMVTSVMLGCFRTKPEARAELLALLGRA